MLDELINKQVICSDVGIIQFMYPKLRIVKTKEDIWNKDKLRLHLLKLQN